MSIIEYASLTKRAVGLSGAGRRERSLVQPVLVDETMPHAFIRRACTIGAAALLLLVVWSCFTTVHEVSRARGTIAPSGYERVIQHFEGGVIEDIFVRAGDIVAAGAPLVRLIDAGTAEDVSVLAKQRMGASAQAESLRALLEDREPDYAALGSGTAPEIIASRDAFEAERAAQAEQRHRLMTQIEQARVALSQIDVQLEGLKTESQFAKMAKERIGALLDKGYASQATFADRSRVAANAENQIAVQQERRRAAVERLKEAEQVLASYTSDTRATLSEKLRGLQSTITALAGESDKKERRRQRLTVTSPIHGIVKSLDVTTLGGVVSSGMRIATVVPIDEVLHAEALVQSDQIGYVAVGQTAQVRITAYDFTRYGWINGTVESISPSSFQEPGQPPYFRVRIVLATNTLPRAPNATILPGMDVRVDIITGEQSMVSWFLRPIRRGFADGFKER